MRTARARARARTAHSHPPTRFGVVRPAAPSLTNSHLTLRDLHWRKFRTSAPSTQDLPPRPRLAHSRCQARSPARQAGRAPLERAGRAVSARRRVDGLGRDELVAGGPVRRHRRTIKGALRFCWWRVWRRRGNVMGLVVWSGGEMTSVGSFRGPRQLRRPGAAADHLGLGHRPQATNHPPATSSPHNTTAPATNRLPDTTSHHLEGRQTRSPPGTVGRMEEMHNAQLYYYLFRREADPPLQAPAQPSGLLDTQPPSPLHRPPQVNFTCE